MGFAEWLKQRVMAMAACLASRLEGCDAQVDSPVHADDPAGGALEDVQLLMAFAAQSRRNVKPDKVTQLMTAAEVLRAARRPGSCRPPSN